MARAALGAVAAWLFALVALPSAAGGPYPLKLATAQLRAPGAAQAVTVALPDPWNQRGRQGDWEYRLSFELPAAPGEPWGIYIPRAGNRFAVDLNDRRLGQFGGFEGDLSDHAQRPHFLFIPAGVLAPGRNELRVQVQGERARYAGLSQVTVGPADEVREQFLWREAVQTWGSFAIVFVSLALGLFALALTLSVRDRSFALFSAACLFCALRTSYALVTEPPIDHRAWSALVDASYAGYLSCLCLFCVEHLRLRRRWIAWATGALLAGTAVLLPLFAWGRVAQARQVFLGMMVLYALALCVAVIAAWYRQRTPASRVLAAAGAVSVALGVHDHVLVFYTSDGYGSFALARYSLITFILAMGWLLIQRQSRQAAEEARLRQHVLDELARQRLEMETQFDHQQRLAAQSAHQDERRRLMQDLHDGMGLQLNGLLGMLQEGPLQRDALSREVRTAIEQMRMLLDSTEDFDGDVSMLLGHIRYRIEQRLKRQGVELDWDVQLVQPQRVLPAQRAIALQRLVFEWTTNALKHAGAARVRVHVRDSGGDDGALVVEFADDGRGFEPGAAVAGTGTLSIARRVADLGARLVRQAAAARGVRYELQVPAASFESPEAGRALPAVPG